MKVIILAGGYGSRLGEITELIPKPMVKIGENPILMHVMNIYAQFGFKDFYLALGYKADVIKNYFLNYQSINNDFSIDLSNRSINYLGKKDLDWKVSLIDTGLNTMTGGRIKRLRNILGDETFMLTYGDGVCNINIPELIDFHKSHGKLVTLSAVKPYSRFGELNINHDNSVDNFKEKPVMKDGWINGGFFIIEPTFLDFIESDTTLLEEEPLETVASMGELMAYRYDGFWQCMDTKRDKDLLEKLYMEGEIWSSRFMR